MKYRPSWPQFQRTRQTDKTRSSVSSASRCHVQSRRTDTQTAPPGDNNICCIHVATQQFADDSPPPCSVNAAGVCYVMLWAHQAVKIKQNDERSGSGAHRADRSGARECVVPDATAAAAAANDVAIGFPSSRRWRGKAGWDRPLQITSADWIYPVVMHLTATFGQLSRYVRCHMGSWASVAQREMHRQWLNCQNVRGQKGRRSGLEQERSGDRPYFLSSREGLGPRPPRSRSRRPC